MTEEEQARVAAEGREVLRDRALLETVAERTGLYMDLEVRPRGGIIV